MRRIFCLFFLLGFILTVQAQEADSALITDAYRQVLLYEGPGITYREAGLLYPGVAVQIVERNAIGNWLHIERIADNQVMQDGWLLSAYLNLSPELHFSDVPVNTALADAAPENVTSQSMAELYKLPVIPIISDAMIAVFEHGQTLGNHPQVITKIGDSLSKSEQYIDIFSADTYVLGAYDYLEATLLYYRDSTAEESVAAQIGLTTYVVFDPFWATDKRCEANESPLHCEYRLRRPAVAFILFGPNDVRHMTDGEFEGQMRQLIDETVAEGIIPVLSTFSVHPDDALFWQAINFNLRIKKLSEEYEIPAINLWAAAQPLPDYGLDEDHIHLLPTGFSFLKYDSGLESFSGISLQNLLVLRTLYEIRLKLGIED